MGLQDQTDIFVLDIEKHLIDMRDITSDKDRPVIQRGFLMVDFVVLQRIIKEIESHSSVQDAAIVSRSGMHIAGEVPRGAHMETYVAMSAILLGAAESATSELHDHLQYISVQLGEGKLVLAPAGKRALVVLKAAIDANPQELAEMIKNFSDQIEKAI